MGIYTDLFRLCLSVPYRNINDSSYAFIRESGTLTVLFEWSNGETDWTRNLDFAAVPRRSEEPDFMVHGGLLRAFAPLETVIAMAVSEASTQRVVVTGYSHGGALTVLCHEYLVYRFPAMRDSIHSVAFAPPRVVFADSLPPTVAARFTRLDAVCNAGDIVTMLPPTLLGYTHVGRVIGIGERGRYNPVAAHKPESYMAELERAGL